jgi:hypothetical protein
MDGCDPFTNKFVMRVVLRADLSSFTIENRFAPARKNESG